MACRYDQVASQGGCALLDFQADCTNSTSFMYLNEFSQWLAASTQGNHSALGNYDNPLTNAQRPGLVAESLCNCSCSGLMVPLNSSLYYVAVGGVQADESEAVNQQHPITNMTIYEPGSAGVLLNPLPMSSPAPHAI